MKLEDIPFDPDCGERHLGHCGGISFRDRLRSAQIHESVRETASRRSYYDHEAVDEQLGSNRKDRKERFLDNTKGIGTTRKAPDGHYYRKDRKDGGYVPVTDRELETLGLGSPT